MACTVSEELTAYVDGELAAPERAMVEAHLATCVDCQRDFVLLQNLAPQLAALPMIEPSAQLRRKVLNALPARESGLWSVLRNLAPLGGLAVTAGVMLAFGGARPTHGDELALARNLEVVEDLGALETADLSDEDLEVVAQLDQLEAKE